MIKKQLQEDIKQHIKEKNKTKLTTVRSILSEIKNKEIELKKDLTEDQTLDCINRLVRQTKESIESFSKANRDTTDLKEQLEVLMNYLPKQLTKSEVEDIIARIIESKNTTEKKVIIKELMPAIKNKFDRSLAPKLIDKVIAGR